jgi:hypothetical protein
LCALRPSLTSSKPAVRYLLILTSWRSQANHVCLRAGTSVFGGDEYLLVRIFSSWHRCLMRPFLIGVCYIHRNRSHEDAVVVGSLRDQVAPQVSVTGQGMAASHATPSSQPACRLAVPVLN